MLGLDHRLAPTAGGIGQPDALASNRSFPCLELGTPGQAWQEDRRLGFVWPALSCCLCWRLQCSQTIEPIIGHLKADHSMDRCHLKGSEGGGLHAVMCAAGYNIRWLLRMIAKKGLGLLLSLLQASGLTQLLAQFTEIIGLNQ